MDDNYTVDLNARGDSDNEWFKSSDFPIYSIQLEGDKYYARQCIIFALEEYIAEG